VASSLKFIEANVFYREITMTKYLSIAILLTGFLVGNAYGASEAYYCSDTGSGGFIDYDKKVAYIHTV
jgi:hypothetical protein